MPETLSLPLTCTDSQRYGYFYLKDSVNAPITNQNGGQPTLSVNSGDFSSAGVGVLTHLSSGNYRCLLSNFVTRGNRVGDTIHLRYSAAGVPQTEGSTIQITRPIWSSSKYASATGIKYINTNSGQRIRRNIYAMPGGIGPDN